MVDSYYMFLLILYTFILEVNIMPYLIYLCSFSILFEARQDIINNVSVPVTMPGMAIVGS